jgi:hypothetical protein
MFAMFDYRYAVRCLVLRALKRLALVALPIALAAAAWLWLR